MLIRFVLLALQWALYMVVAYRLQEPYAYAGVAFSTPGPVAIVLSLLGLMFVAGLLSSRLERPSQGVTWLLASFVVVPTISVAASNPNYQFWTRIVATVTVIIGFTTVCVITKRRVQPIGHETNLALTRPLYRSLLVALAAVGILIAVVGYGLDAIDLGFDDVYSRRLEARTLVDPFPGASYIFTWLKSPLAAALIVIGIAWRSYYLVAVGLLAVAVLFSITGEKAAFVFPLIAVVAAWSARQQQVRSGRPYFGVALTSVIALPIAVAALIPTSNLDYLVTRRFGLTPGMLSHVYVEFASAEGFSRFSQSWLRWLAPEGDSRSLGTRVGSWLDSPGLNANANPFAEGYASAGFFGVVVNAVLLGLILLLFDKLEQSRPRTIAMGILVPVGFAYVNGYVHTSLLTGGVLLSIVLVWFLPTAEDQPTGASDEAPLSERKVGPDKLGVQFRSI